jgi:hypothetical protein
MVYVDAGTVLVPGTTLDIGYKVLADVDDQRVVRVRPAALSHTDVAAFAKLDATLKALGLEDIAFPDAEAWLKQEWAKANSLGRAVGPTDPLQEFDRRMGESKRRFPMTWWHDTPLPGAQEMAQDFMAPRGLPTAMPLTELEEDLDRRVSAGQSEAEAREAAIARLVVEANLHFQHAGLAERFIPFGPHPWEDDEPVWYLLKPDQGEGLISAGVLARPGPAPAGKAQTQRVTWRDVLFSPRKALPQMVEQTSTRTVVLLSALWGIERFFYELYKDAHPPPVKSALQIVPNRLFWGAVFGVSFVWGIGNFMPWFAKRLGGETSEKAVRAVLAWAALPKVVTLLGLFLLYAYLGDAFVLDDRKTLMKAAPGLLLPFSTLYIAVSVWSLGLSLVGLSAVSRLTTWNALKAWVLAGAVLVVPAIGVLWAVRALQGG